MKYALKGNRPGFDIRPTDEVRRQPDGYTEIWRGGQMVGLYRSALVNA
jgi:hypothetical protein